MKLICYLSNGYPSIEESEAMADEYVAAGCDVIEIDLPTREPYLEGELIASRMAGALRACPDYRQFMDAAARIRKRHLMITMLLLAYEATIREIGVASFVEFCLANDMRDLILVGRNVEPLKEELIGRGLRVTCYVQFHLPEDEVTAACGSNAFVYLQSKPMAGNVNLSYPTLADCIRYLRSRGITRPIYCGVGVYSPADVASVKASGGDGVFVGSAILKCGNDRTQVREIIGRFKAAAGSRPTPAGVQQYDASAGL
jgi:tryptophan synthase alpha chain